MLNGQRALWVRALHAFRGRNPKLYSNGRDYLVLAVEQLVDSPTLAMVNALSQSAQLKLMYFGSGLEKLFSASIALPLEYQSVADDCQSHGNFIAPGATISDIVISDALEQVVALGSRNDGKAFLACFSDCKKKYGINSCIRWLGNFPSLAWIKQGMVRVHESGSYLVATHTAQRNHITLSSQWITVLELSELAPSSSDAPELVNVGSETLRFGSNLSCGEIRAHDKVRSPVR